MGLYEKIWSVMSETKALDKNMEVGYGGSKYKAVSEAAVLNEIKPLLKKHKLVCLPVEYEMSETCDTFETSKGTTVRPMTTLKVGWKIVDVETGESEIVYGFGQGTDSQDKGVGKAYTYAFKNMFSKTFCLFSGEDTDNVHSDEITAQMTVNKTPKTAPITDYRQALIDFVQKNTALTMEDVAKEYKLNQKSTQEEFAHALEEVKKAVKWNE